MLCTLVQFFGEFRAQTGAQWIIFEPPRARAARARRPGPHAPSRGRASLGLAPSQGHAPWGRTRLEHPRSPRPPRVAPRARRPPPVPPAGSRPLHSRIRPVFPLILAASQRGELAYKRSLGARRVHRSPCRSPCPPAGAIATTAESSCPLDSSTTRPSRRIP
jgi:hypothetical protein